MPFSKRPCGTRKIGVDKGYTEALTDSDGEHHGTGLGKLLTTESDHRKTKGRRRTAPSEHKRIAIEAAVNLTVALIAGVAIEVLAKLPEESHPHMRGAECGIEATSRDVAGPSPHAWGRGAGRRHQPDYAGSIPTCVGQRGVLQQL